MDATSVVAPATTLSHMASSPLTNGRTSLNPVSAAAPASSSMHRESDASDTKDPITDGVSSDEDAPGEEYDEDEPAGESSESSEDVDAEGEPDGDYDSETPPPRPVAHSRSRTSTSQESLRGSKRKASDDDDFARNPELYGLRRSGRARPTRPIVEDSDDDDESVSDMPRKRQRTTSRKASNRPTPAYRSAGSDSESDGYVGARRNIPSKKERQRRKFVAAGQLPPTHGEVRFSSRRSKQVTNYNEEEDEDSFEEDDDDLTPNYWADTTEYTGPAIDQVLDHRPRSDIELDYNSAKKTDFEYQIKWQDKAHYHSTWEKYETVGSLKGYRKVDNYFTRMIVPDMYCHAHRQDEPEEFEQHIVQRDLRREIMLSHHVVERVIDSRDGDDGEEYYVKWKGLPYDQCTWESSNLVGELSQNEIDRFYDRLANRPVSDPRETNLQTRRKFRPLEEQPEYIQNGQLRSFQLHGLNFLAHNWCRGQNVILADEMGLGKTVQTVSFMNWLRHDRQQQGPFICVVPLSTLPAWAETFNNWTPDLNCVVYTGRDHARNIIKNCELLVDGNVRKTKFNVLITTYEYVLQDWAFLSQIKWQFLAVDEAHRLKNRESQLYEKLLLFNAPSRLLITGTPIQNTLGELSALMDFLMPGNNIVADDTVDLADEDASRKLAELSEAIQPYMIRRTKEKVENDLPPKTEKILRIVLSDIQLEHYKNILTRNYEALNEGGNGHKASLLNIVMELKKASNHALLFPNLEAKLIKPGSTKEETLKALITASGKMMLLDQLLTKLKRDGHRVLIFSQMVHMLDILTDYLRLRNYTFQRLDGTVPATDRKVAIDHFNAENSEDYCFLLSTRAGGLGINLMTADTVVLFDSDWNPQADLQAMARAHRIGQTRPVTVYRLVAKDTIEEEILERARNKRMLEFITIQRGVTDRQQKELNDKLKANEAPSQADDINNILKRRGQKMFEQSGNQKKLEELDIDSVLENAEEHKTEQAAGLTSDGGAEFLKNFEYTDVKIDLEWDDIIPKDELDVAKAKIQERKEEEQTRKLLEESAPRKRKAAAASEREQRAAKKRAKELTRSIDHNDDDDDEDDDDEDGNSDPKRPLNEKETRNLIRGYERYGSLDERGPEMLRAAKLVGRDMDVIRSTLNEVIAISEEHVKKERARLKKLEAETKRQLTKKDKKAVLFDFRGVKKLNAETIIERPVEMRVLKEAVNSVEHYTKFEIPEASKAASYSCDWTSKDDAMLMVGISRHGYGAWTQIRDDPDLGLQDKIFLEEHRVDKKTERSKADDKNAKSPGAVHLVRRANYLLTILKDKSGVDPNAKRRMENHHRNNKKHHSKLTQRTAEKVSSNMASPGHSSQARKGTPRDSEKPSNRLQKNGDGRHSERPDSRQRDKGTPDQLHRQTDQYRPSDVRKEQRGERHSVDRRPAQPDRKISIDGDKKRPKEERSKEERPRPQEERSTADGQAKAKSAKETEKKTDPFMEKKLSNMQPNLKRMKKCLPKYYAKEQMLRVLRCELLAVGNFISHLARENAQMEDLENRLWDYTVAHYWPKPNTAVASVRSMYNKTLNAEKSSKQTTTNSEANGQANGT